MTMPDTGYSVECTLPFACRPGTLTPALAKGSLLLLRVINLMDSHELEADRQQERVEARLDLMLHWLGLQLFGLDPAPASLELTLAAGRIEWLPGEAMSEGLVVLELFLHPSLTAPLRLAGRLAPCAGGRMAADLVFEDEELADAWSQWLFRRHRRAVHQARGRTG